LGFLFLLFLGGQRLFVGAGFPRGDAIFSFG
jgi:hypothetical protein